ncbi:MAG: Uma2 family endonuclease [Bacteroidales bacterium]
MAPAPRLISIDEYFETEETVKPQELIYGVLRVADAPTPQHQAAVFDIGFALQLHLRDHPVGQLWPSPVDVVLDRRRDLVVQPDLVLVSALRSSIVKDRIWGAPDLALEVLSPRPRIGDLDERVGWFARYGVRECWVLHQKERRLEVIEFANRAISARNAFAQDDPIRSRVLPDFRESLRNVLR